MNVFIFLCFPLLLASSSVMSNSIAVLDEDTVTKYLSWDSLFPLVEKVMADFSNDTIVQPARIIMPAPPNGFLLTMPGYLKEDSSLGCKIVTYFGDNPSRGLKTILANIFLFSSITGQLEAVVGGTEITGWRTALASAVGTKYLHKGEKNVLAILGAGAQGRTHAIAFQHLFGFKEVRIWNRNFDKAEALVESLGGNGTFKAFKSNEEAVRGADVICTVTAATQPIIKDEWLKQGAQINAVGAGVVHYSEVDIETYKRCLLITDSMISAEKELSGLARDHGITAWGELGEIINGKLPPPANVTVFQPLGMAAEDIITARYIFDQYKKDLNKQL